MSKPIKELLDPNRVIVDTKGNPTIPKMTVGQLAQTCGALTQGGTIEQSAYTSAIAHFHQTPRRGNFETVKNLATAAAAEVLTFADYLGISRNGSTQPTSPRKQSENTHNDHTSHLVPSDEERAQFREQRPLLKMMKEAKREEAKRHQKKPSLQNNSVI